MVEKALRPSDTVGPKSTLRRTSYRTRDRGCFGVFRGSMNRSRVDRRSVNRLCVFGNAFRKLGSATNRFVVEHRGLDALSNFF